MESELVTAVPCPMTCFSQGRVSVKPLRIQITYITTCTRNPVNNHIKACRISTVSNSNFKFKSRGFVKGWCGFFYKFSVKINNLDPLYNSLVYFIKVRDVIIEHDRGELGEILEQLTIQLPISSNPVIFFIFPTCYLPPLAHC